MAIASEFVIPRAMDMPNGDLFLQILDSNIVGIGIDLNESNYYLKKRFEKIGKIIQRIKNMDNSLQF
jgi:hypothetical protein